MTQSSSSRAKHSRQLYYSTLALTRRLGTATTLTAVVSLIVAALYVASWFSDRLYEWLTRRHLFEAIVIVALLELIIRVSGHPVESDPEVYSDEVDAQARIFELAARGQIQSATILSAGMASRRALISKLVHAGISVELLAQDPATSIDKDDARRTADSIALIRLDCEGRSDKLEIYFHPDLATLRAVVLRERSSGVKHAFIGWYTYQVGNTQVIGSAHPTIYVHSLQAHGRELIDWVEKELARHRNFSSIVKSNQL